MSLIFASKSFALQATPNKWISLGINHSIGQIAVSPIDSNIIYITTRDGAGIFKSIDGGTTWTTINNGLPSHVGVDAISINPVNTNTLYASLYGVGVFKSTNGGNSWFNINGIPYPNVLDMVLDPQSPDTLYVGLGAPCQGVWKTIDGGITWQHTGTNLGEPNCDEYGLTIDPKNSNVYAAATKIFMSYDKGNTWYGFNNSFLNGFAVSPTIDPYNSDIIYVGVIGGDQPGLWKSIDRTNTWSYISSPPIDAFGITHPLITDPTRSNTLYVGSRDVDQVFRSNDGGISWQNISDGLPTTVLQNSFGIRRLLLPKNNANVLYAASYDGAYMYGISSQPSLPVPPLKQTDPNWGTQIYDSADQWAATLHQTIGDWGCALTSATMVLQYNNIAKLPDGTSLDPGSLNTWLKNQEDGYVGDGLINWLAISRLTKQAKSQNPNFQADALEYKRKAGADTAILLTDLQNNQPDILEEPGHFIVATGQSGDTYTINDPYFNRTDLTQGYNNTFTSIGRYIPSHTDLSYMMFVTDQNTHIELKTASGSAIGSSFIQQPLISDTQDNSGISAGSPLTIYLVPQPASGTYYLNITGQDGQPYNVDAYLYDKDGNVHDPIHLNGNLTNKGTQAQEITFDNQTVANDTISSIITFDTFISDINRLQDQNQLQKGPATALGALARTAAKSLDKKNTLPSKVQLFALKGLLDIFHNRGITDAAYNILSSDIQYLLNSL